MRRKWTQSQSCIPKAQTTSAGRHGGVYPILKYIKKDWVVWCPFDTEESNFVKLIAKTNKVIRSHISEGKDFYNFEPNGRWDCIVSNPPFTNKRKIFERERMKFEVAGKTDNRITFSSSYWCWNFLPKQIVMDSLKNYKDESEI